MQPERRGSGDHNMSKGDPFSNIPEDVRERLEGQGRKLEGFEFVAVAPTYIVITYRVDYGDWSSFEIPRWA